jgi:hypothetical protein
MITSVSNADKRISSTANRLLEVLIIMAVGCVVIETGFANQMIVWALSALLLVSFGRYAGVFNRLHSYSHLFYYATVFYIAFLASYNEAPVYGFIDSEWAKALATLVLLVPFTVIAHKYPAKNIIGVGKLKNTNIKALIYPLFFAVAMFLYWSMSKEILSLAFLFECFILFLLSIVLKEPQFRKVSMSCVMVVCARLIFYDLRGQDFLVKAIAFIVAGVLLIIMNGIYNRYKHRYEK